MAERRSGMGRRRKREMQLCAWKAYKSGVHYKWVSY